MPEKISAADIVLTGVATHKVTRLIAKDKVTSFIRSPFTSYQEHAGHGELNEEPRGSGLRYAVGELLACPLLPRPVGGLELRDRPRRRADFEGGFATAPEAVAANVAAATATGIAGLSIEDSTSNPVAPAPRPGAGGRTDPRRAAGDRRQRYRHSPHRPVRRLHRRTPDLADTIRRLTAYAEAGAECVYAPGIRAAADIKAVIDAVAPTPVNILVGSDFTTVAEARRRRRPADQRRRRAGARSVGGLPSGGEGNRRAGHVHEPRTRHTVRHDQLMRSHAFQILEFLILEFLTCLILN